jgi:hypothetical protein
MKNPFSLAILILVGSSLTTPAWAFESLLGNYEGKIKHVEGYSAQADAACSVVVGTSDLFGGAVTFEVQGIEKLLVEKRRVEADFKPGVTELKWVTTGGSAKPGELVGLKLRDDGSLQSLKLHLKYGAQHREKTVVCGELARRQ